jgi:hypothetical protein
MIAGIAGSYIFVSCISCAAPQQPPVVQVQFEAAQDSFATLNSAREDDLRFGIGNGEEFRLPVRPASPFNARNFAGPDAAARLRQQDLSTPLALRGQPSSEFGGQVAFGASAAATGLGLDLQVAPHISIENGQDGRRIARAGAEVRFGQNLADLDQRGKTTLAPSWYFFVGQDNEALIWNVTDNTQPSGVALRDQVTVGDLQAGVALSTSRGGQMSLGLVERETSFRDAAGQHSISRKDRFAAFSFTWRR